MKQRLIIFGTGEAGQQSYALCRIRENCNLLGFVDNDERKQGTLFQGLPVWPPSEIPCRSFDAIVVASMYYAAIQDQLIQDLHVPSGQIWCSLEVYVQRVRACFNNGRIADAEALAVESETVWGKPMAGLVRAEMDMAQRRWPEAIRRLESLLSHTSPCISPMVFARLGMAYRRMYQPDRSKTVIEQGLARFPDSYSLLFQGAEADRMLENWPDAIQGYERVLSGARSSPPPEKLWVRLAQVCRRGGRLERACALVTQGLDFFPASISLRIEKVECEIVRVWNSYSKVSRQLDTLTRFPTENLSPSILARLANAYARIGETRASNRIVGQLFPRTDWSGERDANERTLWRVRNILGYTKASGSPYSAQSYPAGYHSLRIKGTILRGRRDPARRLASVPYDFRGKTVLDIGSNQGGMLFAVADAISEGVGIDVDCRMINAANVVKACMGISRVHFYVFDLDGEELDRIRDYLPAPRVDIVFLLAVCRWILNWREVIDFSASISDAMLFESNGTPHQQEEHVRYLSRRYADCRLVRDASTDDPERGDRKLLLCRNDDAGADPGCP